MTSIDNSMIAGEFLLRCQFHPKGNKQLCAINQKGLISLAPDRFRLRHADRQDSRRNQFGDSWCGRQDHKQTKRRVPPWRCDAMLTASTGHRRSCRDVTGSRFTPPASIRQRERRLSSKLPRPGCRLCAQLRPAESGGRGFGGAASHRDADIQPGQVVNHQAIDNLPLAESRRHVASQPVAGGGDDLERRGR